jgi:hypothetical protein
MSQDRRRIYEDRYRELRHKVFAHKGLSDPQITALFARTNIREMQRMLAFLMALHEALWQLFNNGRKPTLRPGGNQLETISLARSCLCRIRPLLPTFIPSIA